MGRNEALFHLNEIRKSKLKATHRLGVCCVPFAIESILDPGYGLSLRIYRDAILGSGHRSDQVLEMLRADNIITYEAIRVRQDNYNENLRIINRELGKAVTAGVVLRESSIQTHHSFSIKGPVSFLSYVDVNDAAVRPEFYRLTTDELLSRALTYKKEHENCFIVKKGENWPGRRVKTK